MPFPEVRRLFVLAVLVLGLVAPASALAQQPGVTIDPGSPAGKQYQLPTDRSREVAGGSGASATGRPADATDDDGGGSSTTLVVIAVVVVVLVGGGTALVLRRRA